MKFKTLNTAYSHDDNDGEVTIFATISDKNEECVFEYKIITKNTFILSLELLNYSCNKKNIDEIIEQVENYIENTF